MPPRRRQKRALQSDGGFLVHGKAVNGAGSVYPVYDRAKNSGEVIRTRWKATWVDHTGKLRSVSASTKTAASERRDAAMAEDADQASRSSFGPATTVAELAQWWYDNVARHRVRASSLGKYRDRVQRITATLGDAHVTSLRSEQVTSWQSTLLDELASSTVADTRATLRQILAAAVDNDLVPANVVDRVRAPKVTSKAARALEPEDARRLITAGLDHRLGAAVALLFVQGWRVSEVLGLAWSDLDMTAATATVRRASAYVDGQGMVLGPTKTTGAQGVHHIAAGVLALLGERRLMQERERFAAGDAWISQTYQGRPIELVFTTPTGGLVNRQGITKVIQLAARTAGLDPDGLSTHTGRRTVVTTLYSAEGIDLADVARHVGHASPATTAGYVRGLGERPKATAEAAARRLDVER